MTLPGSTWCPQPRHQTIRRSWAYAALSSVIGEQSSDFIAARTERASWLR
jgi:hypothetical protein